MEELKLVIPTMEYKEQVMNYKQEFINNNSDFDGCSLLEKCDTYEEWIDFDNKLRKEYGDEYSPSKLFLTMRVNDNKVVGMVDCRLKLSDFLLSYGGNIGYSVLPTERRKGYAKEMVRLALIEYKNLGINKVLVCCDPINLGSKKTILANGGVLENEVDDVPKLGKSGKIQRYWIEMKKNFTR